MPLAEVVLLQAEHHTQLDVVVVEQVVQIDGSVDALVGVPA